MGGIFYGNLSVIFFDDTFNNGKTSPCPSFSVLEVYFLVKISCINSLVAAGPGFSTLIRKLSLCILSVR